VLQDCFIISNLCPISYCEFCFSHWLVFYKYIFFYLIFLRPVTHRSKHSSINTSKKLFTYLGCLKIEADKTLHWLCWWLNKFQYWPKIWAIPINLKFRMLPQFALVHNRPVSMCLSIFFLKVNLVLQMKQN
jgi:hypothetical protein